MKELPRRIRSTAILLVMTILPLVGIAFYLQDIHFPFVFCCVMCIPMAIFPEIGLLEDNDSIIRQYSLIVAILAVGTSIAVGLTRTSFGKGLLLGVILLFLSTQLKYID